MLLPNARCAMLSIRHRAIRVLHDESSHINIKNVSDFMLGISVLHRSDIERQCDDLKMRLVCYCLRVFSGAKDSWAYINNPNNLF